jgi:phenylpyruvate tautomerase PptA (4-oxalocrotonate tautomerase family)
MPLVRIDLRAGKPSTYRQVLGERVHQAMVETINVPPLDRFQVIAEHGPNDLIYDPTYLDIERSDEIVFIQITLNTGRTVEMKKALYARIVELLLEEPGVRPEDVLISLVEVAKENWSFGEGTAQYA